MNLSIVTPETAAYDGPVDSVVVPGHDGEVAFLPGHAPYVGLLGAGELRCHVPQGGTLHFYLAGGVVQVADDTISVLAETVTAVGSLDATKVRAELEKALASPGGDAEAEAARTRAVAAVRAKLRLAERGAPGGNAH
jgi:F-type H+-transporting ATPase subunit epsilon